ncbi:hypothetical protein UFOVP655_70 [uncultured Caudovirales phage]|uniref:Uncharacterized protein n=1 Tax=uncultured Caudovirales phage TaxID=2100421 RepID=A0A6J5NBT6_9CAUD|nr:hypothetical protein UFOVP655_70 [uncultured Caudovirales phage]
MKPRLDFLKNPERRFLFELAEKLGRSVAELLYGSPAHRPLTSMELTEWTALWTLKAKEQEKAERKAKARR